MKIKYYVEMESNGSKVYKTTRDSERAMRFVSRHEKLGWNLVAIHMWES